MKLMSIILIFPTVILLTGEVERLYMFKLGKLLDLYSKKDTMGMF